MLHVPSIQFTNVLSTGIYSLCCLPDSKLHEGRVYNLVNFIPGEEMATHSRILSWEIVWTRNLAGISNFMCILIFLLMAKNFCTCIGKALYYWPRWASDKEPACQCRRHKRHGFEPWVRKISWRRKWQPTPVFLPGDFQGQRHLLGYSP